MRVKKFLERELDQRSVEGLSTGFFNPGTSTSSSADFLEDFRGSSFWDDALGIGRDARLRAINWLLNVCCLQSDDTRY